ncbi:MAG: hypothetical protein NZ523_00315 [Elioraea sp.]|nr:hypothetical protein [Elioraea sp.]MDW8444116.1 hypothetical protein [Acetobacteraceae bacterium]
MRKRSSGLSAILALVLLPAAARAETAAGGVVSHPAFLFLYVVCGALGGLVAAHRDPERGFVLPHRRPASGSSWDAGFVGDALLGMAGAIAILLIVPGKPDVGFTFDGLRTMALAVIGGYGARAVLEAALSSRLAKVESETRDMLRKRKRAEEAKRAVQSHLEGSQPLSVDDFVALFTDLPADGPLDLFRMADQKRSDWRKAGRRAEIVCVLPILQALERTAADTVPKADLQAAIAMVHFDKSPPDFTESLGRINRAIELAKETPLKYEIIRAVSLVMLAKDRMNDTPLVEQATEAIRSLKAKGGWIENEQYREAVNAFAKARGLDVTFGATRPT